MAEKNLEKTENKQTEAIAEELKHDFTPLNKLTDAFHEYVSITGFTSANLWVSREKADRLVAERRQKIG